MKELSFVVLGAGGIANFHVNQLVNQPGVRVVGFQDIAASQFERWKPRFADAQYDTDPVRLLERTRPDLACVCSSNVAHAPLTLAALAAGCHVLCEKPMAMTVDEALGMEQARQKAGRLGGINFSYRCVPSFRFAREIIRAGEIGRVQRINAVYLQSFLGAEQTPWAWRNDVAAAGFGALGDLGVHMVDGAGFVSGLVPRRIVGQAQTLVAEKRDASGTPRPVTTDTNASFLIEYEGGALGTFETSQVIPGYGNHFRIEVSGDRGLLRICSEEGESLHLHAGATLASYATWSKEAFPRVNVPTDFVARQPKSNPELIARAIRGETVDYPTFADGIVAQRMVNGVLESMRRAAWVELR